MEATLARPIRRLDPATASRIAAGEVVERPLSALKEVVENALDAGARRIEVRVTGALDREFQVADDGHGIAAADLELALERHATSKITALDDLDRLDTLGFRGEALPSIAAVSRMRIASRARDAEAASVVEAHGGRVVKRAEEARGPGTTVTVTDLFFNTPARRKFLSTPSGELRAALRMLEAYALARPDLALRLVVDGRERFDWAPAATPRDRLATVRGAAATAAWLEARGERDGLRVTALLGLPEHARANREGQVVIVNGRWVQNPLVGQALRQAYGNLLPPGRHPVAAVWLEVPPARLDVNVHPTKREVRFAADDPVFTLVAGACARPLPTYTPPFRVVAGGAPPEPAWADRVRERPGRDQIRLVLDPGAPDPAPAGDAPPPPAAAPEAPRPEMWQLHRTYILAPMREGLLIVDQHAAHERILFEQALRRLAGERAVSQRLLFAAVVDLTQDQFELLLELGPSLELLGWDLAPLGPPTVVIHGAPATLAGHAPGRLLQDVLDGMSEPGGHGRPDPVERLARSWACHAAVRAGDPLGPEQMRALVDELFATSLPHGDPHGRPTYVRMELDELHRRFHRG